LIVSNWEEEAQKRKVGVDVAVYPDELVGGRGRPWEGKRKKGIS